MNIWTPEYFTVHIHDTILDFMSSFKGNFSRSLVNVIDVGINHCFFGDLWKQFLKPNFLHQNSVNFKFLKNTTPAALGGLQLSGYFSYSRNSKQSDYDPYQSKRFAGLSVCLFACLLSCANVWICILTGRTNAGHSSASVCECWLNTTEACFTVLHPYGPTPSEMCR